MPAGKGDKSLSAAFERRLQEVSVKFAEAGRQYQSRANGSSDSGVVYDAWEKYMMQWLQYLKKEKQKHGVNLLKNIPYSRLLL